MRMFTQIKGLSETRRLPRLGKIRLGIRVKRRGGNKKCTHGKDDICMYCTYPKETPHFVVPLEVARVYGDKPTELDILLPVNDINVVFPQSYEYYGSSRGLKCTGDGENAMRYNEDTKSMEPVECPCELLSEGKCQQRAHLSVILPKVSVGGIYQIDTGSYNSIVDINSSLDYVTALVGRFAMVPLKLKREPRETHHEGKKQTHYTLRIELEGDIEFLNALRENTNRVLSGPKYAIPSPVRENPIFDGPTYEEDPAESEEQPQNIEPETVQQAQESKQLPIPMTASDIPFDEKPISKDEIISVLRAAPNLESLKTAWERMQPHIRILPGPDKVAVQMVKDQLKTEMEKRA